MEIKFNEIDEVISKMTKSQMKMTLLIMAVRIEKKVVIDKIDMVDSVKIGLTMDE